MLTDLNQNNLHYRKNIANNKDLSDERSNIEMTDQDTQANRPKLLITNDYDDSSRQYLEQRNSSPPSSSDRNNYVATGSNSEQNTATENTKSAASDVAVAIPKTHYVSVFVLLLVNLLNYMDRFTISGVLTSIQDYYSINDSEAGLLQTVFICTYMIFAPACGYLGDRYSRKWIMVCGIFVWSLTVLGSTFVPANHFWLFALCRGIVGIGEASYSTIAPTLIADMFSKDLRSKMLMIFYFAIPVGSKSYFWSTMGFTCVAFVAGSLSWWTPTFVFYAVSVSGKIPDKARISLIFGIITCLSGFLGVLIGSFWAQMWRHTNPRADPLVCGIGLLLCTPFLYVALNIVDSVILLAWPLMFCAITALCLNWAVVVDMLLYIVIPPRRATASAIQILFSHLLGDAFSPYLIGVVSDALRGNDEADYLHFYSLKYAMFIPTFVLVFGGFFFFGTAWFIEDDRKKCNLAVMGVNETDGISVTKSSLSQGGMAPSDSTARLLRNDNLDDANELIQGSNNQ